MKLHGARLAPLITRRAATRQSSGRWGDAATVTGSPALALSAEAVVSLDRTGGTFGSIDFSKLADLLPPMAADGEGDSPFGGKLKDLPPCQLDLIRLLSLPKTLSGVGEGKAEDVEDVLGAMSVSRRLARLLYGSLGGLQRSLCGGPTLVCIPRASGRLRRGPQLQRTYRNIHIRIYMHTHCAHQKAL
jgi:hypothetical protein